MLTIFNYAKITLERELFLLREAYFMTKFGIKNLKKYIDLKTDNWEYNKTTNCYAFALGLDIPENKITRRAYYGGYIYQSIVSNPKDIVDLNNQESIELDFKAMGLYYEQIDLHDKIYSSDEWKIAFLILKKAMIFISLEKKKRYMVSQIR